MNTVTHNKIMESTQTQTVSLMLLCLLTEHNFKSHSHSRKLYICTHTRIIRKTSSFNKSSILRATFKLQGFSLILTQGLIPMLMFKCNCCQVAYLYI